MWTGKELWSTCPSQSLDFTTCCLLASFAVWDDQLWVISLIAFKNVCSLEKSDWGTPLPSFIRCFELLPCIWAITQGDRRFLSSRNFKCWVFTARNSLVEWLGSANLRFLERGVLGSGVGFRALLGRSRGPHWQFFPKPGLWFSVRGLRLWCLESKLGEHAGLDSTAVRTPFMQPT